LNLFPALLSQILFSSPLAGALNKEGLRKYGRNKPINKEAEACIPCEFSNVSKNIPTEKEINTLCHLFRV
jgi:hypothetical protein